VYHGVVIVGYTNNTDSGDYYVNVVNSWGESFGDKGHFWMPMSFVTNSTYCSSLYTIALSTDTINIPGVTTN
jgi:C1A family cysteine protease